jgi:hypothetical protein
MIPFKKKIGSKRFIHQAATENERRREIRMATEKERSVTHAHWSATEKERTG